MTEIKISLGDAVKYANEYEGELFHALFCDSPYHLTSITRRFGKENSSPARNGKDGAFARLSKGFMGQEWDGGDVAFRPETWAAFGKVLHDGAFGITFGGSRGWHRLAVAIEDAGFIIHPTIFGWVYGSGFPKATRVKAEGFEGYRYGLQALKPAVEPIIVFQKPYKGKPIDNITETGAGVLNIDGTRIGKEEIPSNQWLDSAHPFGNGAGNEYRTVTNKGRWASNFILMNQGAADALDKQSGNLKSGKLEDHHVINSEFGFNGGKRDTHPLSESYGDEGGASRFFFTVQDQIDESDPIYYCAKASQEEKNVGTEKNNPHPTVKPLSLNRYLSTLLLPPPKFANRRIFIPFAGVGSEMIGAMQAGWELIQGVELTKEYIPIAEARINYWRNKGWQVNLF